MSTLSHLDEMGAAHMIDVSAKAATRREAVATGEIALCPKALAAIRENTLAKGDALAVARVAGIMAAKATSSLIPLCHPLAISKVSIEFAEITEGYQVTSTVRIDGQTGVEMEALTATSIALLTLYDMTKSVDKGHEIRGIRLISKSGGKSGDWQRP